eukprot:c6175_g1_i1.p1 GENE.c6175_g1_i1~~c6175_g1_i1.p1  ORF type:complete len:276 (-),score=31.09 c6175_g1_i1:246-1073(-)
MGILHTRVLSSQNTNTPPQQSTNKQKMQSTSCVQRTAVLLLITMIVGVNAICNEYTSCTECEKNNVCVWCTNEQTSPSGKQSHCHALFSPFGCLAVDNICSPTSHSPSLSPSLQFESPSTSPSAILTSPLPIEPDTSNDQSQPDIPTTTPIGDHDISGGEEKPQNTCASFYYTECVASWAWTPTCRLGFSLVTDVRTSGQTIDSDGKRSDYCFFIWDQHYKCCSPEPELTASTHIQRAMSTRNVGFVCVVVGFSFMVVTTIIFILSPRRKFARLP